MTARVRKATAADLTTTPRRKAAPKARKAVAPPGAPPGTPTADGKGFRLGTRLGDADVVALDWYGPIAVHLAPFGMAGLVVSDSRTGTPIHTVWSRTAACTVAEALNTPEGLELLAAIARGEALRETAVAIGEAVLVAKAEAIRVANLPPPPPPQRSIEDWQREHGPLTGREVRDLLKLRAIQRDCPDESFVNAVDVRGPRWVAVHHHTGRMLALQWLGFQFGRYYPEESARIAGLEPKHLVLLHWPDHATLIDLALGHCGALRIEDGDLAALRQAFDEGRAPEGLTGLPPSAATVAS